MVGAPIFDRPYVRQVLYEIFQLLACDDLPSQRSLGWIAVSHVCHRWRKVALEHALLWTYLSTNTDCKLMEAMIQRSNGAPLTVRGDGYSNRFFHEIQVPLLRAHLPHIVELDADMYIVEHAYADNMSVPEASILRTVHLRDTPGGLFAFPARFCSDRAPALQHVRLTYGKLPWAMPPFSNLVSLSIDNDHFFNEGHSNIRDPDNAPTLFQLLHILKPNESTLEVLELSGCLPLYAPHLRLADTSPVPNFPRLKILVLKTFYPTAVAILSHLVIPAQAQLRLHLTEGPALNFHILIFPQDAAWFASKWVTTLALTRTLEVAMDSCTLMTRFWTDEVPDEDVRSTLFTPEATTMTTHLEYDRCTLRDDGILPDTIGTIVSSGLSATSNISTLLFRVSSAQFDRDWSTDDWHVAFGDLRTLRRISANGTAATSLVYFLSLRYHVVSNPGATGTDDREPEPEVETQSLPFDRLTHLALYGVDFTQPAATATDDTEPSDEIMLIHVLLSELHERRRRELDDSGSASRIRWLSISACDILEEWIDLLRECVDHVEWDRQTTMIPPQILRMMREQERASTD